MVIASEAKQPHIERRLLRPFDFATALLELEEL